MSWAAQSRTTCSARRLSHLHTALPSSERGPANVESLREQIVNTNEQIELYDRRHEESRAQLRELSNAEQTARLRLEEIVGQLPPIPRML